MRVRGVLPSELGLPSELVRDLPDLVIDPGVPAIDPVLVVRVAVLQVKVEGEVISTVD